MGTPKKLEDEARTHVRSLMQNSLVNLQWVAEIVSVDEQGEHAVTVVPYTGVDVDLVSGYKDGLKVAPLGWKRGGEVEERNVSDSTAITVYFKPRTALLLSE